MPGIDARSGFIFQDSILLERILEYRAEIRRAEIMAQPPPQETRFGVESSIDKASPDWDILRIVREDDQQEVFLEEVKSGNIDKNDRIAFWLRLRRSYQTDRVTNVILTVDADNPPEQTEHWRGLVEHINDTTIPTTVAPGYVNSVEKLVEEALFYLVTEDQKTVGAPSLNERQVKDLLSRFSFNERSRNEVLTHINELIASLQLDLGIDEVRATLAGSIGERAASVNEHDHLFTAEEITKPVTVLNSLAAVDPNHARIWRDLQSASKTHVEETTNSSSENGLAYQNWRSVQTDIATTLDDDTRSAVAIIGRGGTGKSVVLERYFTEQTEAGKTTIWIDASSLTNEQVSLLSAAINLGVFCANLHGKALLVCIDALEMPDGPGRAVRDIVAELSVAARFPNTRIISTCRDFAWSQLRDRAELENWRAIPIEQWNVELVSRLVNESVRRNCSRDLLEVLRTPLFLDIFLRTFPVNEVIPEGIQTRYGVLSAYWRRRVWGSEAASLERRSFLTCIAASEAKGQMRHSEPNPQLSVLISEGIFSCHAGQYTFRHPLLRDFALMLWALDGQEIDKARPSSIANRFQEIKGSLARFGAWRQVLEALSYPSVVIQHDGLYEPISLEQLAEAVSESPHLTLLTAEILGEIDDPSTIDIDFFGRALQKAANADEFGARLIKFATMGHNFLWLSKFNGLPESADWSSSAKWIDGLFLVEFAKFIEVAARSNSVSQDQLSAAARRLREWSRSGNLRRTLDNNHWRWGALVSIVALHAPSQKTLDWLTNDVPQSDTVISNILQCLPALIFKADSTGISLCDKSIVATYLNTSGFEQRCGFIADIEGHQTNSMTTFYRIETCLLGQHSRHGEFHGLLDACPRLFIPVALDIIVGDFLKEQDENRKPYFPEEMQAAFSDLAASFTVPSVKPPKATEITELEAQLFAKCQNEVTEADVLCGLVDDVRSEHYCRGTRTRELILTHLTKVVQSDRVSEGQYIRELLWPAVSKGSSAVARVLLLDLLVDGENIYCGDIVDLILADKRIYHCSHVQYYLWSAINARWPNLDLINKNAVIDNIRSLQSRNGVYRIGRYLSAIPESERPADLLSFLTIFDLQGRSPIPDPLDREDFKPYEIDPAEPYDHDLRIIGLSPQSENLWREVAKCQVDKLGESTPENINRVVDAFRAVLVCLPKHELVEKYPWVLDHWSTLLRFLVQKRVGSDFHGNELRILVDWAFKVTASCIAEAVNSERSSLNVESMAYTINLPVWCDAIRLIDVAILHPTLIKETILRTRLFTQEIQRMIPTLSPQIARSIFTGISSYNWFNDEHGRTLLTNLLMQRGADPGALYWALHHLRHFRVDEQKQLFTWWLENEIGLPMTEAGFDLAGEIGEYLGRQALLKDGGEFLWIKTFIESYLTKQPSNGILTIPVAYRKWLIGIVFGAKESVRYGAYQIAVAADYAALMQVCQRQLKKLTESGLLDADQSGTFTLYVFGHILDSATHRNQSEIADPDVWWRALEPLACEIVREGNAADVAFIVFDLREFNTIAALGPRSVIRLVRSLDERLKAVRPHQSSDSLSQESFQLVGIEEYGAEIVKNVALALPSSDPVVNEFYTILESWPREYMGVLEAKRAVREHGGLAV
jgi:hypothetical protein